MKKTLSMILVLVMLVGLLPQITLPVSATDADASNENPSVQSDTDLFVFAGQSNMMGAAVLEPQVNSFTDQSLEYKYMPKLRGEETGSFVPVQNSAGEWHYNDLNAAYGDYLSDLSYKSTLNNYSANTYFCPAMSNGTKGFSAQSEADMYPSASLPPYFVTEYANYGHSSIYAHMAKGSAKIVHYFNEEMTNKYNALISAYNVSNNKTYKLLDFDELSGAGDAFNAKYTAMVEDYTNYAPDKTIKNKCFVWLQGESDGGSYIEYKLKMQVLWEHLQELGFTHFFVLRVGYWGNTSILNIIKAQEDFCAENENCYIVTRAPSLIPHPSATTDNWWISEPDAEYADCRDSYVVSGSSNHHFNEKAMQIFAERSAKNIHRILYQGLDPILEEENIQGMLKIDDNDKPESDQPEDTTPYTSYMGTEIFYKGLSVSKSADKWVEKSSSTAASTELIPVTSADSVWLQYVFFLSEAHAVGGFYDKDGNLVAPLYYKDFGFSLGGGGGAAAFCTPEVTNRISIADIESATGKEIAFVRFTAWQASAGGHANTEARIYHEETNTRPFITQQPESIEQEIGKRFAITVKAEGDSLTYQWYYKDAGMKNFGVSSNKTSAYAYTMQSYMHNRQVYCVITDANGNQVTTDVATITRPPMELTILAQPKDVQTPIGQKFSIGLKVQGDGLTYQWYYKDAGMKNFSISSNKTSAYAYAMQSYMHNRQVYCVITDQYGNQVTTDVATITRPPVELTILEQPKDVQTPISQKFSISPKVQGDGLTYQWYYKDADMQNFSISSNKTSAYAYAMQSYMHNRQVYCVITDQYGNQVTTDVATITRPPVELKLLSQPTDVYAAKGEKFSVSFDVQGDGLTYQWYYKESYMENFDVSSNKTSAYSYAMQSYMNNRQVYCIITDQYGNQVETEAVTLHEGKN